MRKIYFLEGNISSGKSELGKGLKSRGYVVYQEPVDEWREKYKDKTGENILQKFYDDRERYAFQFEVLVMITRWMKIKNAIESGDEMVIIERSLDTDANVFAKGLYLEGSKTDLDWQIYMTWYSIFKSEIEHYFNDFEVCYIYLVTPPGECKNRIEIRSRNEESTIPIEYLERLHSLHEEWMDNVQDEKSNSVHYIDGRFSKSEVLERVINVLEDR